MERIDNKERLPLEHYRALLREVDPEEASLRCNVAYDIQKKAFSLKLMDRELFVSWPDGQFTLQSGEAFEENNAIILILRYLCEMGYSRSGGKLLDYRQIPWGDVYYRQFEGRCIKRLAYGFGTNLDGFRRAMAKLGGEALSYGDVSYRFPFLNSLSMAFVLWAPDEEFGPSAQILFDDAFPSACTAEDCAVAGDISISRLKALSIQTPSV